MDKISTELDTKKNLGKILRSRDTEYSVHHLAEKRPIDETSTGSELMGDAFR